MKIVHLFLIALLILPSFGYAAEDSDLPDQVRDRIEAQTHAMSAVGVPPDAARNMLTIMHQNQFREENIVRAQQTVMNCARQGLPTEPVMSKALEGMAKQAGEQQTIAAMEAVQSRYAYAHRKALTLSKEKSATDTLTKDIADSLAAGMRVEDMDKVMAQLQVRTRKQTQTTDPAQADKLAIQTMQTMRTMARLRIHSSEVSDTLSQALQNRYTYQEMAQLRHRIAQQTHQASVQQIASRHAGEIGKSRGASNSRSGPGSGAGVSGSGPGSGGSGPGGGGSGPGGGGSGPGGGGSGPGGGGGGGGGGSK